MYLGGVAFGIADHLLVGATLFAVREVPVWRYAPVNPLVGWCCVELIHRSLSLRPAIRLGGLYYFVDCFIPDMNDLCR